MEWSKFYDKAYSWILNFGPKLIVGLVILFVGLWLIKFFKNWLNHHLLRREVNSSVRPFLLNVIVIALQFLLVLSFMQVVGIQLTVFTAVVGAFGVAAGLALSGTLQNFTSGVLILLLKPFRVGDNVIAQGQEGTVKAIQIFFTIVTTYDNKTVIIPNSKLSNEIILNLSCEDKRRLDIELKFGFGIDFNQVKTIVEKTLAEVQGLLKDPAHRIGVSGIDPDGYKVMINVWAPPHGFMDVKMTLQERLVDDLKKAGVKLPGM
jgi:small conductance mechanosensitive channel